MPDGRAVLEIGEARKRFGDAVALDGVDLALGPGEWLGLVGPNGAGKTTLMRAICGLTDLDGGSIRLLGRERRGLAPTRDGGLGLVPQEVALYPALTARENLGLFGRLHGLRGRDLAGQTAWALEWTGLEERADRPVSTYSGGMKRRLNIACGVLHRPRLVLLDEPTVGVDPQGRGRIWRMLDSLRGEGTALLQSSHHLDEVESRCDRLVILDHGRVVAEGTMEELARDTRVGDRILRVQLDRSPNGLALPPQFRVDGATVRATVRDVATELSTLLERLRGAGLGVVDIDLEAPRLEEIFTHLTGSELRE